MRRRQFLGTLGAASASMLGRSAGSQETRDRVRMIFDSDSVGDDILAIYFAARHPKIQLEAVTTVNGASGSLDQANRVALRSLDIAQARETPVHPGADGPLVPKSAEESAAPVHFEKTLNEKFGDRLKGFNAPAGPQKREAASEHAVDFIIRTVKENPGDITLVATGPWTNLGLAFQRAPEIASLVREILVMGGVFRVPGNITPVVEYNVWADPEAAKIVVGAGAPLTIVGLDVCEHNSAADSMMTRDDLFDLERGENAAARDITSRFPIYIDIWREFFGLVGFPMDDVIAVALAIDKTLCGLSEPIHVDVALEGQLTRGQTIAFEGHQIFLREFAHPPLTRVCRTIDGKRFMSLFKQTMIAG